MAVQERDRFSGNNVNYERFPPQYFSGSNVYIYFEDIFIDEIETFQFELKETLMPIYGYNSHKFDSMLRGTRIVQGSFKINFKNVNYIHSAVDAILENPEDFDISDEQLKEINSENINKLYNFANRGWSTEFQQYSEDFKQKMWGDNEVAVYSEERETYFKHKDKGFDIRISYGDHDQPTSKWKPERTFRSKVNTGTVKAINNVHIQSVTQSVDMSGEPVSEIYTFLAQDLDKNI